SWIRPETQHLTFAFLGEQPETLVDKIAIDGGGAFDARLTGCGFFPNRRHARVGWVGAEPHERFVDLCERVRTGVTRAGLELEHNEFKPHLTLMRIRDHWPPMATELFEKSLRDFESAPFAVHEVTLYLSRLIPTGAVHTPLRTFALGLAS
ncbi:MAG TPA: RNA 2',3'-cyclic phosphodiesterase, partial [Thermoanaerobaculia bacterium]